MNIKDFFDFSQTRQRLSYTRELEKEYNYKRVLPIFFNKQLSISVLKNWFCLGLI